MISEEAKKKLRTVFDQNDLIEVVDERGDGKHYFLKIVSAKFEEMNRLQRSRMVYEALDNFIGTDKMHAVRMELKAPKEV